MLRHFVTDCYMQFDWIVGLVSKCLKNATFPTSLAFQMSMLKKFLKVNFSKKYMLTVALELTHGLE